MILAEDEVGLGADHAGIMLLPDGLEPGNAARGRPAARRPRARRDADDEPARPALDGRPRARGRRALRRRRSGRPTPEDPPVTAPEPVDIAVEDFDGLPAVHRARLPQRRASARRRSGCARRLHLAGMRSISNVVDVTNYVMHVWGSPLHAFDRAKLAGGRIVVRRAREGETLRTLDGTQRELLPSDLLITDGERAVALAAIMGGLESEVSEADDRGAARGGELRADRRSSGRPSGSRCAPRARTSGRRASTRTRPSRPPCSRAGCSSTSPAPS